MLCTDTHTQEAAQMGVLGYHSKQTGGPEGVLVSQQVNHPSVKSRVTASSA